MQVELALKEKGKVGDGKNRFGKTLVDSLFTLGGKHKTIKLHVPLGDDLQRQAKAYFQSVFSYYRNYLAHDGSKVDQKGALRVLVIASELLDMIGASSLSYKDLGGIEGLLRENVFTDEKQLYDVLKICDGYPLFGHESDGLREALFMKCAAVEEHLDAVFDLELVRYIDTVFHMPDDDWYGTSEEGGWIELTDLGNEFLSKLRDKAE